MKTFKSIIILAVTLVATQAFSASIVVNPKFQAIDEDGAPLVGGCLYSYDCGTTSKAATCADYLCNADNTNPIELDARGEADVYSDQCFKLALYEADIDGVCDTNPSTTLIWTKDNIPSDIDGTSADGSTVLDLGTDGTDAYFIGDIQADNGTEVLSNGTDGSDSTYIGDIYATNGTSLILDSGTDGANAIFTGDVTGDVTGGLTGNVTGGIVSGGTGSTYNVDEVNTGDWNMNTTPSINVSHGIADYKKIRRITATIRSDDDTGYVPLDTTSDGGAIGTDTTPQGGNAGYSGTTVTIERLTGGIFDAAGYSTTSYNRGFITIWYID